MKRKTVRLIVLSVLILILCVAYVTSGYSEQKFESYEVPTATPTYYQINTAQSPENSVNAYPAPPQPTTGAYPAPIISSPPEPTPAFTPTKVPTPTAPWL